VPKVPTGFDTRLPAPDARSRGRRGKYQNLKLSATGQGRRSRPFWAAERPRAQQQPYGHWPDRRKRHLFRRSLVGCRGPIITCQQTGRLNFRLTPVSRRAGSPPVRPGPGEMFSHSFSEVPYIAAKLIDVPVSLKHLSHAKRVVSQPVERISHSILIEQHCRHTCLSSVSSVLSLGGCETSSIRMLRDESV